MPSMCLIRFSLFLAGLKRRWSPRLPGNFVCAKTVADVVIVIAMFVLGEKLAFKYLISGSGTNMTFLLPIFQHADKPCLS